MSNKADIRNIAVPKTLGGYSQEIGCAGHDDLESSCMIYLCSEDIGIMEEWSRADVPSVRSVKSSWEGWLRCMRTLEWEVLLSGISTSPETGT
jgi:superfamily II DNA helicase RecQ